MPPNVPEMWFGSSLWHIFTRRLALVFSWSGVVLQLALGVASATGREGLQVKRTVDFISIDWDGEDHGRLDIEITGFLEGSKFVGNATVAINWLWVDPTCKELSGFQNVNGGGAVAGSIDGNVLRMTVAVPVRGKFSSLLGEFVGIPFCLTRPVEFRYDGNVMSWGSFDVELAKLTHDSTVTWSSTEGGTVVLEGTVHTVVHPVEIAPGTEVDFATATKEAPLLKDSGQGGWRSATIASAGGGPGVFSGDSPLTELVPFIRYQLVRPPRKEAE